MPLECFLLNITRRDLPRKCEKICGKCGKMQKNADRISPLPLDQQIKGSDGPSRDILNRGDTSDSATQGALSHSAGTAPIIALFIPGTPLKTTPLQRRA